MIRIVSARLLAFFMALAFFSPHASAATLQATPATLSAQATAAQPGDVIQLATGVYGTWAAPLNLVHASPGVVIQPSPGATPVFTAIDFWGGAGGYTVQGVDIQMAPTQQYGMDIEGVSHITIIGVKIHQADNQTPVGVGILLRDDTNVTVQGSEFSWLDTGILGVADTQGALDTITIAGNAFHDIGSNGTLFLGVTNAVFKGNTGINWHNANGTHPDFLQFANDNGVSPATTSAHVAVNDNHFERGTGDQSQGVFIEDGDDWSITDNSIIGAETNGIAVARSTHVVIEGNFVQPYADVISLIVVRQAANIVAVNDNVAQVAIGTTADAADDQPTNVTPPTGNAAPPVAASPTDYTAYDAWQASLAALQTPPPVVVVAPPAVDPLQPALDAAKAQIATDSSTIAGLQAQIAALPTASTVAGLNATITSLNGQVSTLKAQLAAAPAMNTAAQLKTAQASLATANAALTTANNTLTTIKKAGGWK